MKIIQNVCINSKVYNMYVESYRTHKRQKKNNKP